ncbi:MAG: ABC transporter substrate-binding protein [Dinoroseobacter sp.]|nr:ABC transporter substrate-binding protein [Dinoroseobacter sp.]
MSTRRRFIGGALSGILASPFVAPRLTRAAQHYGTELLAAGYAYNHVRALISGKAQVDGHSVTFELDKIGDLNNHVFEGLQTRAFSEVGLHPFMLSYANDGFRDYTLIPVFPLRTFRHKSVFIHADAGIEHPSDLKGRRVATPGFSSTSLTWIRGFMADEYGVMPEDIEWVVSAKDSAGGLSGTVSKNENMIPEGLNVTTGPDGKDESDLLLDRDVDALFHAAEPRAFVEGHPKVTRLFKDPRSVEQDYFKRTGIYPIMHAVAVRNDLIKTDPALPAAIFRAYVAAKNMELEALKQRWYFETMPWFAAELESTIDVLGENFFPYGIAPNRKTLEALFRYSYQQGLASRELTVEELFDSSVLEIAETE